MEVRRLVEYAGERGLEFLLGCDANAHHVAWGSSDINHRGENLHEFLRETGLLILTDGPNQLSWIAEDRKL